MHNQRVEVHLPCPPLADWFARRWSQGRIGTWEPARAPRRLRSALGRWPTVDEGALSELDALLFGVALERPEPPEAPLSRLRTGAQIVELALPRLRPVRGLLGLGANPLQRAAAGQARVQQWIERGYCELEQWESVDPAGVIVTIARVR